MLNTPFILSFPIYVCVGLHGTPGGFWKRARGGHASFFLANDAHKFYNRGDTSSDMPSPREPTYSNSALPAANSLGHSTAQQQQRKTGRSAPAPPGHQQLLARLFGHFVERGRQIHRERYIASIWVVFVASGERQDARESRMAGLFSLPAPPASSLLFIGKPSHSTLIR